MNGAINAGLSTSGSASLVAPVKNPKSVRISQLNSGFLIEAQNVETYGFTNDVALDLEGAVKIATDYFAA